MPRFSVNDEDISSGFAEISGADYRHLVHVRRVKPGETVYLAGKSGSYYCGIVSEIGSGSVRVRITESFAISGTGLDISLYLCLIKGGNFEYAIQKSVEVGVNRIIPVISERTVPDPDKKTEKKRERWNRIAEGACKQCMRGGPVPVGLPLGFAEAVESDTSDVKIAGHPGAPLQVRDFLHGVERPRTVSILIGPEGGFSESELITAGRYGWNMLNFGFTHLRAETAAAVIPALIIYHWSSI